MIYTEFFHIVKDYFRTLNRKEVVYELIIPIFLGVTTFLIQFFCTKKVEEINIEGSIITSLSVLIGFSLAVFTVITASSNEQIDSLKKIPSEYKVDGIVVTLYHLLLIGIVYPMIIEIALLISNLIYLALPFASGVYLPVNIIIISHVLLVTIRAITNLYFVLTKR